MKRTLTFLAGLILVGTITALTLNDRQSSPSSSDTWASIARAHCLGVPYVRGRNGNLAGQPVPGEKVHLVEPGITLATEAQHAQAPRR